MDGRRRLFDGKLAVVVCSGWRMREWMSEKKMTPVPFMWTNGGGTVKNALGDGE